MEGKKVMTWRRSVLNINAGSCTMMSGLAAVLATSNFSDNLLCAPINRNSQDITGRALARAPASPFCTATVPRTEIKQLTYP